MTKEESIWIKRALEDLEPPMVESVLDVGSSTKHFRTQTQPYIDENVFKPLREKGITIFYLDKKKDEGVDYFYDVVNLNADEIGKKFDLVICCSLLEHVNDPRKVCLLLKNLLKQEGCLLVTVPKSYRYHPDPIDTMFRPSIKELLSMFKGMEIIQKEVIRIKDRGKYKLYRIAEIIRYLIPSFNWKINCLFLRKSKI